ncbi:MAG TPA: T9SS type A sorting domain-containing protein [Flavobacteriales bacterium]|nr:T9SS type A sorting domain-containing protein [Flavobacteriales bacterium]
MNLNSTLPLSLWAFVAAIGVNAQPGTLDPTFNGGGVEILQPGAVHDVGHEVIALPDSTTLVCGTANVNGTNSAFVMHLMEDGQVDPGWGMNSGYTFLTVGLEAYAYDMAVDASGNIYLCGLTYTTLDHSDVLVVKLLPDGSPDDAFGTNGIVVVPIGTGDAEAQGIAVQDDGKTIVAGHVGFGDAADGMIMRLKTDGNVDGGFGAGGMAITTAYPGIEDAFQAVDVLDDGSIMAAGDAVVDFLFRAIVAKVDGAGVFVTAFDGDGVAEPLLPGTEHRCWGILGEGTGAYICGQVDIDATNRDLFVAKVKEDGTLVGDYGTSGVAATDVNENDIAYDIAQQADGKIVVCGTTGSFGFLVPRDFIIARYNPTGVLDDTFGSGGTTATDIQPDFDDANGVDIQEPSGKILVTGFTAGSDNDLVVARYLGDDASTGVAAVPALNGVMAVYPNPAASVLYLDRTLRAGDRLSITDAAGRSVLQPVVAQRAIDVSGLPTGMYWISLITNEGTAHVPFVKE